MVKKKATVKSKPVEKQKIEKPKSLLDVPVKEFFSFNVDREIKDAADRSRNVVEHFNRNGITIEQKRRLTNNATPYLVLTILVILFVLIVVPGTFIKAIFLLIGALFVFYYLFKIIKR